MGRRVLLTDTFDRADSGTLGSNWTAITSPFVTMQISSNAAKGTSGATNNGCYWSGAGWTDVLDMWAEGIIGTTIAPTEGSFSLDLRQSTSAVTMWYLQLAPGAGEGTHVSVIKRIANVSTNLSNILTPWVSGDVILASVVGSVMSVYTNDRLVNQWTDASIDGVTVGGSKVGLGSEGTIGTWASWTAGDFEPIITPNKSRFPKYVLRGRP